MMMILSNFCREDHDDDEYEVESVEIFTDEAVLEHLSQDLLSSASFSSMQVKLSGSAYDDDEKRSLGSESASHGQAEEVLSQDSEMMVIDGSQSAVRMLLLTPSTTKSVKSPRFSFIDAHTNRSSFCSNASTQRFLSPRTP
jgi:hypothetical protein